MERALVLRALYLYGLWFSLLKERRYLYSLRFAYCLLNRLSYSIWEIKTFEKMPQNVRGEQKNASENWSGPKTDACPPKRGEKNPY